MKLIPINQIKREDLPEAPDWINKLIGPINMFMENVYRALDNNLTFQENIVGVFKEIYVSTDDLPYLMVNPLKVKPKAVLVGQVRQDVGYHADETTAMMADWEITEDGKIKIHNLAGLDTNKHYIQLLII